MVFSGRLDGHLRAYAAATGKIIWDIDTKRSYATVNGVPAQGGSLDEPGAVVVDGMLYVNSGYASSAARPAMCCWRSRWMEGRASAGPIRGPILVPRTRHGVTANRNASV